MFGASVSPIKCTSLDRKGEDSPSSQIDLNDQLSSVPDES
jgi:hypothetical protein